MAHRDPGNHGVRVQRVGIIAQGRNADTVLRAKSVHVVRLRAGETADVNVRDAGEFALGLADGPAHDLNAREPLGGGEFEDLVQVEFGEDGSDESKLHIMVS